MEKSLKNRHCITVYSILSFVEVVDAVYAEKKIPKEKKFFVAGHSMGGTWTLNLAACPETRDRIEAIAPISAPTDLFNPRVTKDDKTAIAKGKNHNYVDGRVIRNKCCKGILWRWAFRNLQFKNPPTRPDKSGDFHYGEDWGFNAMYEILYKHALGPEFGGPPTIATNPLTLY